MRPPIELLIVPADTPEVGTPLWIEWAKNTLAENTEQLHKLSVELTLIKGQNSKLEGALTGLQTYLDYQKQHNVLRGYAPGTIVKIIDLQDTGRVEEIRFSNGVLYLVSYWNGRIRVEGVFRPDQLEEADMLKPPKLFEFSPQN